MKVDGEARLESPVERVWAAFEDPQVLAVTIPGCQRLERTGQDDYRMSVEAGVAAIRGRYEGEVRLVDKVEPHSLTMLAAGSGDPGTIEARVRVTLAPDGSGAVVGYDADVVVGGMIGGVSQRLLARVGRRLAEEFFTAIDARLRGMPEVTAAAPDSGPTEQVVLGGSAERPGVPTGFTAGMMVGGALVLLGVVAGGLISRRGRSS